MRTDHPALLESVGRRGPARLDPGRVAQTGGGSRWFGKPAGEMRSDGTEDVVDPAWLEQHLNDPYLYLVEVDVSSAAYDEGHIDGAVLWNVYGTSRTPIISSSTRRRSNDWSTRSGIDPRSKVVFYGYAPAMGFWLMKLYGHADVRILDCSVERWGSEGRPWTQTASRPSRLVIRSETRTNGFVPPIAGRTRDREFDVHHRRRPHRRRVPR